MDRTNNGEELDEKRQKGQEKKERKKEVKKECVFRRLAMFQQATICQLGG